MTIFLYTAVQECASLGPLSFVLHYKSRVAQWAALCCTASSFVIPIAVCGDHTVEAYSKCARTNVV